MGRTEMRKFEKLELLRQVVSKRSPELLEQLSQLDVVPLTDEHRERLRAVVMDEFCDTGLQEDSEPNQRGLALEEIVDLLGHL